MRFVISEITSNPTQALGYLSKVVELCSFAFANGPVILTRCWASAH